MTERPSTSPIGRPSAEYAREHNELRAVLKARVERSIMSAENKRRTVESPAKAADYVVNSLLEWPDGHDLIRRMARHLDAPRSDGSRVQP